MANLSSSMADIYQTQLEASRRFADAVFSCTEKMDRVLIEATHRAFSDQMSFAQDVASARDPQGVVNAQAAFISRRPDSAVDYQKEIIRVFTEMQNEIGGSMRDYVKQVSGSVARKTTPPLKAAQDQVNEAVLHPANGMLSVWESAFREAASLANRNMAAVRSTFEDAAQSTQMAAQEAMQSVSDSGIEASRRASRYVSRAASAGEIHSSNGHAHAKGSNEKKSKTAASRRG